LGILKSTVAAKKKEYRRRRALNGLIVHRGGSADLLGETEFRHRKEATKKGGLTSELRENAVKGVVSRKGKSVTQRETAVLENIKFDARRFGGGSDHSNPQKSRKKKGGIFSREWGSLRRPTH